MNVAAERVYASQSAERGIGLRRGRTWILAGGDLVALALAYAGTHAAVNHFTASSAGVAGWIALATALLTAPIWIAVFTAYHLYDNDSLRISVASFDEVRDVFHALLAGSFGFLLAAQVLQRFADGWIYSAVQKAFFVCAAVVLVPIVRGSIRSWLFPHVMQRRRALIVGSGREAQLVQRKLRSHPEYGLEVVEVVDADPRTDLAQIVDDRSIDRVLVTSSGMGETEMLDLVRALRRPDVQVSIVPRYFEIFTSHATLDDIEGMPVVSLPPMRLGRSSRLLKRSFDVVVAGLALLVLSPVLAAIALAIRLDSKGGAIYRQPRRGRQGSTFRIAKFRTMQVGAEQRRDEVLHLNEVDGPLFKIKGGDPRITRVGGFLRRTSLDELPQLWNVLRGEMSLVGPRPFVLYEADQITGWASRRLDMTPGITGLWQVLGRNDIPFDEMVKLDYLYVTNWSLWWDCKILCQTIPVVLGRRGAY